MTVGRVRLKFKRRQLGKYEVDIREELQLLGVISPFRELKIF